MAQNVRGNPQKGGQNSGFDQKCTKKALEVLGLEVLSHPPYSPDLAPTDYHLFRSLANHLSGRAFKNQEDLEAGVRAVLNSKYPEFWKDGVYNLVKRWEEVGKNNGEYIINM